MKVCIATLEVNLAFQNKFPVSPLFLDVALTNLIFEGGKADLAKGLSANFQVAHSFTLGSMMQPSSYHFASVYASGKVGTLQKCDKFSNFR
jgi:hypothetical protein